MLDAQIISEDLRQLDTEGYVVLPGFANDARIQALRTAVEDVWERQGEKAGTEFRQEPQTRRLANLINCGKIFQELAAEASIIKLVNHVLSAGFKLSSLNFRSSLPDSDWKQPLHCDAGLLPDAQGNSVCNVIWLLDDFTADNGPTRFVPGSHRSGKRPEDVMENPAATHPEEKRLIAKAGTVVVMNAHLWHGALANGSDRERRAIHSFYCRRDQPQQQYQKALLDPEVQRNLSPEMRHLLAIDDPENDRLCAQETSMSGFLR